MRRNHAFALLAVIIAFSISPLKAEVFDAKSVFTKIKAKSYSSDKTLGVDEKYTTVTEYNLAVSNAERMFVNNSGSLVIKNFPVTPISTEDVELVRISSAVDGKTKWMKSTANGDVQVQGPSVVTYKGKIKGKENSIVILTYSQGFLNGSVKLDAGEYFDVTTSLKGKVSVSSQNVRLLTGNYAAAFAYDQDINTGTLTEQDFIKKHATDKPLASKDLLEARIAIEGIYNYYVLMDKKYDKAAAYIASVMSYVSILYEQAINVRIYIPYVLIRTDVSADPYEKSQAGDFNRKLSQMPSVWASERPDNVTLICMFAALKGQPGGTNVAGLSYGGDPGTGSLCNTSRGYSIFGIEGDETYPNYNYTWDVSVAAHEIGHNFGSPHTHNCYYMPNMIDTCVTQTKPVPVGDACLTGENIPRLGTIMSYCHIANSTNSVELVFHPRQIPAMRAAAEKALCISTPSIPTLQIIRPLAENKYIAGDKINIEWVYFDVDKVNIYYSPDFGGQWIKIAENVSASEKSFSWNAPDIKTDEMIFKLEDAKYPELFDVTDAKIKVVVPGITINKPVSGLEFSSKEKVDILWESTTSNSYNVYFSADGGSTWTLIKTVSSMTVYQMDLPDVKSDNCLIKVEDADNSTIVALSPVFKVGSESFAFTRPAPGDTICGTFDYSVEWNSSYVHKFIIQTSTDGGATWKNIKLGAVFNAEDKRFIWKSPKGAVNIRLRALLFDDNNIVLNTLPGDVVIDTCKWASAEEPIASESDVKILQVDPNPASDEAVLTFDCAEAGQEVYVSVVSSIGETVAPEMRINALQGSNSQKLNLSGLATGRYFAVVKTRDGMQVYPITVIR